MSKRADRLPVLVTMGEPAGIGPEIAVRAFHELKGRVNGRALVLVGARAAFGAAAERLALSLPADRRIEEALPLAEPAAAGRPSPRNADAVIAAIARAAKAAEAKEAAAIVTAPIHKATLMAAGFPHPGHTEFLAVLTGAKRSVMMLAGTGLRVVPLTIHRALRDVPGTITADAIAETARIVLAALRSDFGIDRPRLAVAGLNPHAGEQGEIGREDIDIIAPAVTQLQRDGHTVTGPHSADTLFHDEARARYDAALCMYHDQALIPVKTLDFWGAVNVTLGLPIVRTSPDHGTALDIAGTATADARSMIAAIEMAAAIADRRGIP